MLEKTIEVPAGESRFNQALDEVAGDGPPVVYLIERDGKPVAALVPIAIYEQMKRLEGDPTERASP